MKKLLVMTVMAVALNAANAASPSTGQSFSGVTAKSLEKDFKVTWPTVVQAFKWECTTMTHANVGSYAATAQVLAKVENVDSLTVDLALKNAASTLQPFVDLVEKSADMFAALDITDTPDTRGLLLSMSDSALGCQKAKKELEVLTQLVIQHINTKGYEKTLTETDFLKRLEQVTRHVLAENVKKFPALSKDL